MIGFISVSDIPKLLISFVLAFVVLLGFVFILSVFPGLINRIPEGVFVVGFLALIAGCYWISSRIWERIQDRW